MKRDIVVTGITVLAFALGVTVGAWIAPTITSARYQYEYGRLQMQHQDTVQQANDMIQDLRSQLDETGEPVDGDGPDATDDAG